MRIRSIHPEQWIDSDFLDLSLEGRLLALALRNFADDRGIFEVKHDQVSAYLCPRENYSREAIETLFCELEEHRQIKRYSVKGQTYGIIRNFCKWQSPKKPCHKHPAPSDDLGPGYQFERRNTADVEAHSPEYPTSTPPVTHSRGTERDKEEETDMEMEMYEEKKTDISKRESSSVGSSPSCKAKDKRTTTTIPFLAISEEGKAVLDEWNTMARTHHLNTVEADQCPPIIKEALHNRLADEYFSENWREALRRMPTSDLLMGRKRGTYKTDLKAFLQADTVEKIMAGALGVHNGTAQSLIDDLGFKGDVA